MKQKLKPKPTLGQTVWLVKAHQTQPQETIITKIGSKYFEIEADSNAKYHVETWQQVNVSNYYGQVYETLQEILDNREFSKLQNKIMRQFQTFHSFPFTLDQVRRLVAIIEEPKNALPNEQRYYAIDKFTFDQLVETVNEKIEDNKDSPMSERSIELRGNKSILDYLLSDCLYPQKITG